MKKFLFYGACIAITLSGAAISMAADETATDPVTPGAVTTTQTNLAALWNNNGELGNPMDFGWQAWNAGEQVTERIYETNHSGGTRFRDNNAYEGEKYPHLLLHFQTTGVSHFAFPLDVEKMKPNTTYRAEIMLHRHNSEDTEIGVGINTKPDGSGTVLNKLEMATHTYWHTYVLDFSTGDTLESDYFLILYRYNGYNPNLVAVGDINVYELNRADITTASPTNPVEMDAIVSPGFEQGQDKWSGSGFSRQNNGEAIQNGAYYMEKWVTQESQVGNANLTQNLTGIPSGKYLLTVSAQNRAQSDPERETAGAYVFAGDNETLVNSATPKVFGVEFTVINPEASIPVGFRTRDCTGNWVAFDDFHLYYLGNNESIEKTLTVTITDDNATPMEGATVTLSSTPEQTAPTNASGQCKFTIEQDDITGLTLTVEKAGYKTQTTTVVWGSKPEHEMTVVLKKDIDVEGNLLRDIFNGETGKFPTDWKVFTRAGVETEPHGMATLRNNKAESKGEIDNFLLRWENTDQHDKYYSYPVTITETGIYRFSMKCTEFNNWNASNNAGSQIPEKSAVRVSLTNTPGYDYIQTQSHVFDMPTNNPASFDNAVWKDCTCLFFAEAGEYYLSFVGANAIYPVKELMLVKDPEATMMELPAAPVVDGEIHNYGGGMPVFAEIPEAGRQFEQVFLAKGSDAVKTYGPHSGRPTTEKGILYIYEIVNGVNSAVAVKECDFAEVAYPEEAMTLGEGMIKPEDPDIKYDFTVTDKNKATIEFESGNGITIYYRFIAEKSETPEVDPEANPAQRIAHAEYDTPYKEPLLIDRSGKLTYHAEINGIAGKSRSLSFKYDKTSGILTIEDDDAGAAYYTLDGVKLNGKPAKGIFIKIADGKAIKIIR